MSSRYMPVHKSHLSGKTKTILRCYLVISATWKRNRLIYFPCVMFHVKHLKKVPTGVEKALSKRPMHTSQQEEYEYKSFPLKRRQKLRSWCCGTRNSFHSGIPVMRILQSHFDHYCSVKRQRRKTSHLQT